MIRKQFGTTINDLATTLNRQVGAYARRKMREDVRLIRARDAENTLIRQIREDENLSLHVGGVF